MKGLGFVGLGKVAPIALFTAALAAACSDGGGANDGAAGASGGTGVSGGTGLSGGTGVSGGTSQNGVCKAQRDTSPSIIASTALDPDTVARAATVVGACLPDDGVARNANYMWSGQASSGELYYRFQMQAACLANSKCGCAAVANCLGYRIEPSATACDKECTGNVFSACNPAIDLADGFRLSFDCSSLALSCDPEGLCLEGAPTVCTEGAPATCASGRPEYCDDGIIQRGPVCADLGLDCVAGACVGRGAACTGSSAAPDDLDFAGTACSGSMLSACANGHLSTVDCSTRGPGFSCQHVGDTYFCGLAAQCAPAGHFSDSSLSRCDGNTFEFCNAGRVDRVDCLSLGFSGCSLGGGNYGCIPGLIGGD